MMKSLAHDYDNSDATTREGSKHILTGPLWDRERRDRKFWRAAAANTTQHDSVSNGDDECRTMATTAVAGAERCWCRRRQGDALIPGPGGRAGGLAST